MCARCQAYIVHKTRWHYDGSIKHAKITLKQYLIDVIFFVLHILCFRLLWYLLTKNVDSSIQYVIHDRKPRFENKKHHDHPYILYYMILQSVFHVWETIFVSYSNAFYDAYCNNSFSLCLISDPFVIEIYQDTCIIHVE